MARSECRTCGLTFGALSAFDRHLRWSKGPPWVAHLDPARVGLVESDGVWKHPANIADFRGAEDACAESSAGGGISRLSADVQGCVASSGVS